MQTTGKDKWANNFPICKDNTPTSRQSPIDIKLWTAEYNPTLKPLKVTNYDTDNTNKMQLSNNGHSINVAMNSGAFESMVEHEGKFK